MTPVAYQFKEEFGITLKQLGDLLGKTSVWASNFVNGKYKDNVYLKVTVEKTSQALGIEEDKIFKYALGHVVGNKKNYIDYKTYPKDYKHQKYLETKTNRKKQIVTLEQVENMINDLRTEIIGE